MDDRNEIDRTDLEGRLLAARFRIADVVSIGATTVIATAVDEQSQRAVTVKIVRPALATAPDFAQRFSQVAELSAAITHPNIAPILHWGPVRIGDAPTTFWISDYLGGGSLRDLFDRGRLLEPSQALVVGLEACRALDAAHQKGLVHAEITPSKLVFGEDRRLRVVDFGLARLLGEQAWRDPPTVPTDVARYASPEQARRRRIDPTTDVYALSLCLIEAVTGSVPFAADSTVATLSARTGRLMPVSADLGALASVLERAGRPRAADRFSAAEFGRALVDAAPKLPRPDPIPVLTTGLFDTSQLRRPTDPTGGLARPEPPASPPAAPPGGPGGAPNGGSADVPDPGARSVDGGGAPDGAPPAPDGPDRTSLRGAAPAVAAPLLVLNDLADPPTGGVEVARADGPEPAVHESATPAPTASRPTAPEPTASESAPPRMVAPDTPPHDVPEPTEELPIEATQAGAPTEEVPATATAVDHTGNALYDEERRPRRIGKVLVLLILVLAGIGAATYAGYLLLRTKSYEVPDLVGVSEAVARNEVAGNGWEIITTHERSDEIRGIGDVIRTQPAAGVMLDEGETIEFVISDGPELRTLPELDGRPVSEAQSELEALELDWIVGEATFHEEVPIDSVISWRVQNDASLAAGGQVLPGAVVILTPSMGPEPRVVPTLANLTLEEATAELASRRLGIERGADLFSDEIAPGRIVTQQPAPESVVERDSTITVQVSKGPDVVEFPDIVGAPYADAEQRLIAAGFTVGAVLGSTTDGAIQSATIGGNPVAPGDVHRRGTAVDLVSL